MNVQTVKQKLVAERFRKIFNINNLISKARTCRNGNLRVLKLLFSFLRHKFVVARDVFLVLCLTTLCAHMNPLKFALNFFLALAFVFVFKCKALVFLLKPGRIITLKRIAFSAVKFKNPSGNIVKEVAVVGDGNYCSRIVVKVFFKPGDSFCIKVVCRLVKKKNVRFLKKQAAQSNAASFTSGKNVYNLFRRRTSQRVHSKFQIVVKIPCIKRIKFFLNFALARTQFVYVCIRITERFVYPVKFGKQVSNFLYAFLNRFKNSFSRLKLRFLLQIAYCIAGSKRRFSRKVLVNSCKNLEKT